ncbi:MAG: RNA-binding S4 domain-containing protein [Sulfurimonas sp.]|nr:MAG: RNA-binding S4 domain-containing protein [Sulfurimonas sp.]
MQYPLREEYIELYKLIKVLDLVDSGAEAKRIIAAGHVLRNGDIELRKRAKIRAGERIDIADIIIKVVTSS